MFNVTCPGCGHTLSIHEQHRGAVGTCKACGTQFTAGADEPLQETVPLRKRSLWPWLVAAFILMIVAAGAGFGGYRYITLPARAATPPGPPIAENAPTVELEPVATEPSEHAVELAVTQSQLTQPPRYLTEEFDGLLAKMKVEYSRSSELQLRDAVYEVYNLRTYNRPDIDVLRAARMLVDWLPPSASLVGNQTVSFDSNKGVKGTVKGTSSAELVLRDIPVSMAVESITKDVLRQYDDWVAQQWDAYNAQQDAVRAEAERREAVRQAEARAIAEAQRIQAQGIIR